MNFEVKKIGTPITEPKLSCSQGVYFMKEFVKVGFGEGHHPLLSNKHFSKPS